MIYVISTATFGEHEVSDIQCNANWCSCPDSDYALIPDELVEGILATQGYCDIALNADGTEVTGFTARTIPSVPYECCAEKPVELLWQNSKPTSEFGACDVDLDLTPFDYITIEYAPIATSYLKTAFCKVGGACLLDAVSGSSNASSGESGMGGSHVFSVWRNALCTDKTKVHFTKAVRQAQDSNSVAITDSNFYVIPVRIYGIRGVSA